jgi:general L-amino acid transport system permease protein
MNERNLKPRVHESAFSRLKKHFFSTKGNAVLTLIIAVMLLAVTKPIVQWAFVDAVWFSTTADSCTRPITADERVKLTEDGALPADGRVKMDGACWPAIWNTAPLLVAGRYPHEERWRIGVGFALLGLGLVFAKKRFTKRILLKVLSVVVGLGAFLLVIHGVPGTPLKVVETNLWGGFLVTFVLAFLGIAGAFPIGLLLAIGRRSKLFIVQKCCVIYIETIRGVPLVTVLFMANFLLPLFLPASAAQIDPLLRALVAVIAFQAAYIAEVVRGGLQAIPSGQYEASQALGLSSLQSLGLVILPQALRVSLPPLVGTFISLLKDTSLVAIIGLFDLLGSARNITSIPEWAGRDFEALCAAGLVYWVMCYFLSRYSISIENKLQLRQAR